MSDFRNVPAAGFCDRVWAATSELQEAIRDHPFNEALAAGSLDRNRFVFYLVQDARYLVGFSLALSVASSRAAHADDAAFLSESSHAALVVERSLHTRYLDNYGLPAADASQIPTSPSCLAYTSYLLATAFAEPFPVIVAALLPCFWIYHHVGSGIHDRTSTDPSHPYRDWINTYADESFAESVALMRNIVDRAAIEGDHAIVDSMARAFCRATEYEWMFWESAWREEKWPTAKWVRGEGLALSDDKSAGPRD